MLLKRGTISRDVAVWQKFLGLPADGIFGGDTEKATKTWQSKNGLDPDGKVGPDTLRKAGLTSTTGSYYPPKPAFTSPSSATREKMFGKFNYRRKNSSEITILGDWVSGHIVKVKIPQLVGVEGAPKDGTIYFHKEGAEQIAGFFAEVERQGLLDLVISWAGSFYPRFVRGSKSSLSNHSWGTAFDINAPQNWLGAKPAAVGVRGSLLKLVPIANSFGFFWGGHYNSRLDGMHFELAVVGKSPKPGQTSETQPEPEPLPEVPVESETPSSDAAGSLTSSDAVAIEKPEPKGFINTIRTEVSALVVGNGGVQALVDKAEQAKTFGFSAGFWKTLGVIVVVGSLLYLIYRYLDYRHDVNRDLEITNRLIEANSTPTNRIHLVDKDQTKSQSSDVCRR